jgi:two-component system nitrogen regulation sensor histidine kinase GlnL
MTQLSVLSPTRQVESLRANAFDVWPEPALLIDSSGVLSAVNEAAEDLFGQWLSALSRGPITKALPTDSPLVDLIERCRGAESSVKVRNIEVAFFGHPSFNADAAATPTLDGAILLTLHIRSPTTGVERATGYAG